MTKVLRGVVYGKTIELENETGLEDGSKVEVTLRAKELPGPPPGWRPGSTKTVAGALADLGTEEEDKLLEEIHQDRKRERRPEDAS